MEESHLLVCAALRGKKTDKLPVLFWLGRRPLKKTSADIAATLWLDAVRERVDLFSLFSKTDDIFARRVVRSLLCVG